MKHKSLAAIMILTVPALMGWAANPAPQSAPDQTQLGAHYVGSQACGACHAEIYARWKKTPMVNVVRDPREHSDAILPDLTKPDPLVHFTRDQIALVYGSIWKQRYFTKIGDDYYVFPAQWDITAHVWRRYFVENGTDWWAPLYPADNMKRPTGPLCDGCHSVGYDSTRTAWQSGMWVANAVTAPAAST